MPSVVLLALLIVALILAGIELLDSHGRSLVAWAVLVVAVVLVLEQVT